ncbi:MAG: fused MFS/spermidine synthase [Akkermansiaceae bacterium]
MIIYLLVFLSGFSALIYQVLWMKQLGLLFGNTSHAAGATFAAFFAGLAVGSWFWGRRSEYSKNSLKVYAGLELGIAFTALLYFVVMKGYYVIYPEVFESVHSDTLLLLIKFVLALVLIFPPAFCMGGTIPVIGQYAIRIPSRFGSTSALLYGINTMGATLGALLAGFFMPVWFGFRMTCWIAIGITLVVAVISFLISRKTPVVAKSEAAQAEGEISAVSWDAPKREQIARDRRVLTVICFLSGFGVLALEVLWTRMFSLVLENSVYTFAAILVVVLSCLAGGALISSVLARTKLSPNTVLAILLGLSGFSIALTPTVFMTVTDSFQFMAVKAVWGDFVLLIFQKCALTIGPPALVLGAVFPYLMKTEERYATAPGKALGRLATINTVGAIFGSLVCAFFLLDQFGMWRSLQIIGIIYFAMAVWMAWVRSVSGIAVASVSAVGLILLMTKLDPSKLPATGVLAARDDEVTLKTWEGSDCTVSVVRGDDGLSIKINSDYGLGSTNARIRQVSQAEIPLMLKPDAKSVFFLGMGTGISAGAALSDRFPQVERVVTCELSPNVIAASKEFMTDVDGVDLTKGLFTDPRSTVMTEDGRHYLMATKEMFDVIDADLFVPYRSGAGSLYTREHFESVKQRLKPKGIFVQWLPAYQVTEFEFHVVGRTMLEVFDQVSLWRCDFAAFDEVIAFVGHNGGEPLAGSDFDDSEIKMNFLRSNGQKDIYETLNPQTALVYYAGNVSASEELFAAYPVNTDDRPVIEYMAPRYYRDKGKDEVPWFVGPFLLKFIKDLQEACPPEKDPLLVNRTSANRRLPLAGSAYQEVRLWAEFGNEAEIQRNWSQFVEEWLDR